MVQELQIIESLIGTAQAINERGAANGADPLPFSPLFFKHTKLARAQLIFADRYQGRPTSHDFALNAAASVRRAMDVL
jgi:hypothetical protein